MLINQKVLFSKEECIKILSLIKTYEEKWKTSDRNYLSHTIGCTNETEWIFNKLINFFETSTNIKIKNSKKYIHFHKYVEGGWFGRHNDMRQNRMYSVGVLLNDTFDGGNFILYNNDNIILDKVAGNTYIFDVRINHEIKPIIKGERYSLIWFLKDINIVYSRNKLL